MGAARSRWRGLAVLCAVLLAGAGGSARADDDTRLPLSGFAPGDPGTVPASQPTPHLSGGVEMRFGYGQRRGGQAQLAEAQLGAAFGVIDRLELSTFFAARYLDQAARNVVLDPLQVQLKGALRLRPWNETGAGFAVLLGARIPLGVSGGDDRIGFRLGLVTDQRFSWGLLWTVYAGTEVRLSQDWLPAWAAVDLGLGFSFEIWRRIGLHVFVSGSARVPLTPLPSTLDRIPMTASAGFQVKGPGQTFFEIGGCYDHSPLDAQPSGWCLFARLVATPGRDRSLARFTRPEEESAPELAARRAPVSPSLFADGAPAKAGKNLTGFPGLPGFDLKQVASDATLAVDLANRKYLGRALAERGMEAIYETLHGVVVGVTIGTVLLGVTIYYNASLELTELLLQWLGLGSLVTFGTEKLAQFAVAFEPFLRTVATAHGDPAKIDQAARQYANAVAIVTGAAREALFFLAAANGLDPILKQLEATKLGGAFDPKRLRAWLDDGVKRIQGRRAAAGAPAEKPVAPTAAAFGKSAHPEQPVARDITDAATIQSGKPAAIYHGYAKPSPKQARLLEQLPRPGSSIVIPKRGTTVTDLAALTAATGDEFTVFTRGGQRMVVRGDSSGVPLGAAELRALKGAGWKWSGHTHPGANDLVLDASGRPGDRLVLEIFGQDRSLILNSRGARSVFDATENTRISPRQGTSR